MFDRIFWHPQHLASAGEVSFLSGTDSIAGLTIRPDAPAGAEPPAGWRQRLSSLDGVGRLARDGASREITLDEFRSVSPSAAEIVWRDRARLDAKRFRIWLDGRGDGLLFSFSKVNPALPHAPHGLVFHAVESELKRLRDHVFGTEEQRPLSRRRVRMRRWRRAPRGLRHRLGIRSR